MFLTMKSEDPASRPMAILDGILTKQRLKRISEALKCWSNAH